MKKASWIVFAGITVLCVLLITFLATGIWNRFFYPQEEEEVRTRIIIPREAGSYFTADIDGFSVWEDNLNTFIPLEDAETVLAILNREREDGLAEDQFVIYRTRRGTSGADSQTFMTYLSFDPRTSGYRRMWNAPVAATRTETINIFSQDLIGDRNNCVVVTGMNENNEHTMTIFRRPSGNSAEQPYRRIAEIQIDGSIVIQETTRSIAYQHGIARGQSFNIAAYGHDILSANILDQIETIFSFNPASDRYEQIRVSRIPGSQIEQRRLREILSGESGGFENFINDLWFYISAQGTIDISRYLYFDPAGREIIFFDEGSQQVFQWQSSTPTRSGLFIRSQNISISTLLRFIDIELESLDRIRLRVTEDIRIRITATATWDGSYRRAGAVNLSEPVSQILPAIDAVYDSSWGRIQFNNSGIYSITSSGNAGSGRYIFFNIDNYNLIELRPDNTGQGRMVYKIDEVAGVTILSRVRVGTTGIHDLFDPPVTLTPVE